MVTKEEKRIQAELALECRSSLPASFVIERPEDRITSGASDMIVTGNKICSRWELKHATPDFKTKGIQELTMLRLAKAGFAWYIVYWQKNDLKMTFIVEPRLIGKNPDDWMDNRFEGFDHAAERGDVRAPLLDYRGVADYGSTGTN